MFGVDLFAEFDIPRIVVESCLVIVEMSSNGPGLGNPGVGVAVEI